MKRKTLTERVAELERELEELKAAPNTEQHFHYHYPPYRSQPIVNPYPYPAVPYRPYWSTIGGTVTVTSGTVSNPTNVTWTDNTGPAQTS